MQAVDNWWRIAMAPTSGRGRSWGNSDVTFVKFNVVHSGMLSYWHQATDSVNQNWSIIQPISFLPLAYVMLPAYIQHMYIIDHFSRLPDRGLCIEISVKKEKKH